MSPSRRRTRRAGKLADENPPQHAGSMPVDSSWRLVDGEHDSFDTTILPSVDGQGDHVPAPLSSGQPSSGLPSQLSSQGNNPSLGSASASQDSIRDFVKHQDDEQVILREPFRPSVISASSSSRALRGYPRTPDPQFKMPLVDLGGSGRSARTVRPFATGAGYQDGSQGHASRRHDAASTGSPLVKRGARRQDDSSSSSSSSSSGEHHRQQPASLASEVCGALAAMGRSVASLLPSALRNALLWAGDVVVIALSFARYPLGLLLAAYLVFGGAMVVQNMATRSVYSAMSPLCRLPGTSFLHLPFCPPGGRDAGLGRLNATAAGLGAVEFDRLMGAQSRFEQVLERSADGVSLPFQMKRSEAAVRDLRTLVRHSDIQARHELVLELDGYIDTARQAASGLQRFNAHVGSAVDAVISINRWTSRYIDSLSADDDDDDAVRRNPSSSSSPSSALAEWAQWILSPFQPADDQPPFFSERVLLDKYVEHTGLVSERIAALILEAQAVLRLLTRAEDHLGLLYDITSRSSTAVSSRRQEMLRTLWTRLGGNAGRLHSLARQLSLLREVDAQRSTAVRQVSALLLELESIQANLGDLRDRVAEPRLVAASSSSSSSAAAAARIPLSVHIETIDRGVDRLQAARARIRAAEDDRVRDFLAKAGLHQRQDHLIDVARGT
ncbi:hypothetical protein UVI_02006650 [Ustilaginoidea virens]|uniref:Uncharacterized protein n=1 Tax=Ustilaginoidea virens TaxID=1159556 RepID=A0A1B5KW65_USTVR|nr:hypothetical protein UVI_02006650 [Ustilaginoidea virens]